jgi:CBS-domain-containing membrane protein
MSPRAAWRLEALGYGPVYDYVAGKSDWSAAGLPTEGTAADRPRVRDTMDAAPTTCGPREPVGEVVARLRRDGHEVCVVVNELGVVQGRLRLEHLDDAGTRAADDVMEPGPATVRADADPIETFERMRQRGTSTLIVSTPDGVLLGVIQVPSQPG